MNRDLSKDPFISGPKGRTLQHFVNASEDLGGRCRLTATEYDAAQAAGIVRRLLIDGNPLAVQASKITKETPVFTWTRHMYTDPDWGFIVSGHWLDPALTTTGYREPLGADVHNLRTGESPALLAAEVMRYGSDKADFLSVRDLVKWLANDEGGVHVNMINDPGLRERFRKAQTLTPWHTKWTMIAISRVVYRGLEPMLYQAANHLRLLSR